MESTINLFADDTSIQQNLTDLNSLSPIKQTSKDLQNRKQLDIKIQRNQNRVHDSIKETQSD